MLWEVLPEVWVLQGVLLRVLREIGGASGSAPGSAPSCGALTGRALPRALPEAPPISLSTLGRTPRSTPTSGSTSRSTESTSKYFPLQHACDWRMGLQKYPFSIIKHPQDTLSLQNKNWHPRKRKLAPSKKGLATSNLQFWCRHAQKCPPSPIHILEDVNLLFGG